MKFTVTFKDPDGVYESLDDAAEESVKGMAVADKGELADLVAMRRKTLEKATEGWIEYGEYVDIEFDTEAKTATVVKRK